jgi:hypothetical protein
VVVVAQDIKVFSGPFKGDFIMTTKTVLRVFVLGLAIVAAAENQIKASLLTVPATWNYSAFGGSGTQVIQSANALGGATYINSYGNPLLATSASPVAFRSLGAVAITGLFDASGNLIAGNPTGGANATALLVFALEGNSVNPTTQQFTSGAYAIVKVSGSSSFDRNNPLTWGLTSGLAYTSTNIVFDGVLGKPDNVFTGPGGMPISPDGKLVSNVITTDFPSLVANGTALGKVGGINTLLTGLPANFYGVIFDNIQENLFLGTSTPQQPVLTSVTNANTVFGGLWTTVGMGGSLGAFNFASGLAGGNNTGYVQGLTGDFAATFNAEITGPTAVVPEPFSMIVWGLLLAAGGIAYIRRARKANA